MVAIKICKRRVMEKNCEKMFGVRIKIMCSVRSSKNEILNQMNTHKNYKNWYCDKYLLKLGKVYSKFSPLRSFLMSLFFTKRKVDESRQNILSILSSIYCLKFITRSDIFSDQVQCHQQKSGFVYYKKSI